MTSFTSINCLSLEKEREDGAENKGKLLPLLLKTKVLLKIIIIDQNMWEGAHISWTSGIYNHEYCRGSPVSKPQGPSKGHS